MVSMQPFVSLVVVVILDGALANTTPKCQLQNTTLCQLLEWIHKLNVELKIGLEGNDSMRDIKEAVVAANQAVFEALTRKENLLSSLKQAFILETVTRSSLENRCKDKTMDINACEKVLRGIFYVIVNLARAIMEIVEGDQKAAIEEVYEKIKEAENKTDHLPELVRKVLEVI